MKLSEFSKNTHYDIKVLKDAEIESAGFVDITYGKNNFVFLRDIKYLENVVNNNNVSTVIVTNEIAEKIKNIEKGIIVSKNPEATFFEMHNALAKIKFYGKDIDNCISESAIISPMAYIASKNVIIGDNVVIEQGAVISEHVKIGNNCYVGPGTVLGARGFKYYRDKNKTIHMEHVGWTELGENVEIIANTIVAQGVIDKTYIDDNSMINALVNIGHGVKIGKGVAISAGSVIAGAATVEDGTWIGLNATICQKLHIGKNAYICMGAVVTKNVQAGEKVSGNFAIDHSKTIKNIKKILKEE